MNASLLLTALFNGAWQGALLCGAAALIFRFFRRLNATTMFTVWSVLLAIAVLLPAANYAFAPRPVTVHVAHTAVLAAARSVQPLDYARRSIPHDDKEAPATMPTITIRVSDVVAAIFRFAPEILAALALVALLRLGLLGRDVVRMLIARSRVRPIEAPVQLPSDISRPFSFAASGDFTSPCVLGFSPALIVLPEDLLGRGDELASVVLHEREHVRRFDDIQNVVQRFIGAIAFFCPGVRIALRELALYREQICDDAAVNATGDRVSYAMTLTDLAQWAQGRGVPVPSLIFKRKHLMHRLEVLLDSAVSHSLRMNRRFAAGAVIALVIAAAVVLRFQVPVIAFAAEHPAAPAAKVQHAAVKVEHAVTKVERTVRSVNHTVTNVDRAVIKADRAVTHVHNHVHVHAAPVAPIIPRAAYEAVTQVAMVKSMAPQLQADVVGVSSPDILDALNAAGLRNLSVDDLIALRDHGVNAREIRAATSYFGRLSAHDLTYLADHGVGPMYIETLRQSGINGIDPQSAVQLMDHGVTAPLIHSAFGYFGRRPAADLTYLADHGVNARYLDELRDNGITGIGPADVVMLTDHGVKAVMIRTAMRSFRSRPSVADLVQLADHGVDCQYIEKAMRFNPNASVADVIRLRDSGF